FLSVWQLFAMVIALAMTSITYLFIPFALLFGGKGSLKKLLTNKQILFQQLPNKLGQKEKY
ncbi:MAG: hypothetical protein C4329_11185, partial [Chitinophagaceae bacterium]